MTRRGSALAALLALEGCAPRPLRYLALGDSYTVGEGVSAAQRWPSRLAARLGEEGLDLDEAEVVATTGWTVAELQAGIDAALLRPRYDLVSVLIGVNDQVRGADPEAYRAELRALLERGVGLAGGEPGRLIVLSIPDWGMTPYARARDRSGVSEEIDRFNAVKREETARLGARWVEVTEASRRLAGGVEELVADGLHPGPATHDEWARLALPAARGALGAPAGGRADTSP